MRKISILGIIAIFLVVGCKKKCWRCTSITQYKQLYIKGNDTIVVYFTEGTRANVYDTLWQNGYMSQTVARIEIPIDYTFCNEGVDVRPYENCYRVAK